VCTRGSDWALLCGPSTSPLAAVNRLTRLKLTVLAAAAGAGVGWTLANEPTGPQWCEDVEVLGVVKGWRGSERFNVVSYDTGRHRLVGRFKSPFSADYVGPAALFISVGKWTGWEHYKVATQCTDVPAPNNRWRGP
jgi:hypothetical protein